MRGWWRSADLARARDDLVDEPVLEGLFGAHPEVAVAVLLDLVEGLTGLEGDQAIEPFAQLQDFLGGDPDVRCLAARAARRLVQQEARIGQRVKITCPI